MTKKQLKLLAIRVVVTFIQAAVAYVVVSGGDFTSKTVLAGAVGAGLSALYNFARNQWPEIFTLGVVKG